MSPGDQPQKAPDLRRQALGDGFPDGRNLSYVQKSCLGQAGKLMMQTGMIGPGARVGVAVSGGMDSLVLLTVLSLRQRIVPFRFEIMALHLNPGFDPGNHAPLAPLLARMGLSGHIEGTDFGPRAHSGENRKRSPCFYCAWLRRKRLFDLCRHYGLTHLAFGHNADDLAATFFLNLTRGGRVDGLSSREPFFGGALSVIRPLLLVEKKTIGQAGRAWELPVWPNPCPHSGRSARLEAEELTRSVTGGDKRRRNVLFNALRRFQVERDMKKNSFPNCHEVT